ncbi:hypothetical protein DPMN_092186 [Dreissena polymorpha]|uniref:NADH dehydrogenase [ubiquinone] iron-sulfur protein 5 n=2 Tax=Dreissena polymorpha TaxID=45954 RepID=A0A9D4R0R0_DREPO|nr:hypothetical protein DPMN_092186 [Dreissena polymorpha]
MAETVASAPVAETPAKPKERAGYDTETGKKKSTYRLLMLPSRVPYIDYFGLGDLRCGDMEIEWRKCAQTTGLVQSKTKCKVEWEDFFECKKQIKTLHRRQEIFRARLREGSEKGNIIHPDGDFFK